MVANRWTVQASLTQREAVRYTPAGIPALDLELAHESEAVEAGSLRQVKLAVKAVALGAMADRLASFPLGEAAEFTGFLATSHKSQALRFHIQDFFVSTN